MKRYLVFAYSTYYPGGGRNDYLGDFDSLTEADEAGRSSGEDSHDILDTATGRWSGRWS